jgi:chloride channel 7
MGKFRKVYINTHRYRKVLETAFWVSLTATIMYLTPLIIESDCLPTDESNIPVTIQYLCEPGEYNPLATLFFNPLGKVFRMFLSPNVFINYNPLLIYFVVWYGLAIVTLGTNVPAGLFVSGILIGCAFGRLLGLFLSDYIITDLQPSTYALIGACALLSGYARHSMSLAIIMLECSEQINLFFPVIFTLFVAYAVGGIFNRSIYIVGVRIKNIPFLTEEAPHKNHEITADIIM